MKRDKIIVLGITGFTGYHFLNYFYKKNLYERYEIVGVDIDQKPSAFDARIIYLDVTVYSDLAKILVAERPDYIVNFVGAYGTDDYDLLLKLNAQVTYNLLDIIVKHNLILKKILLIGTAAEYGNSTSGEILTEDSILEPINLYGLSKKVQSEYMRYFLRKYNLNLNMARTFNVVGKNMSECLAIPTFIKKSKKALNYGKIIVGNLSCERDFIDIRDAVDAYWKILIYGGEGQVYNVCSGCPIKMKEILDFIMLKLGVNAEVMTMTDNCLYPIIQKSYGSNSKLLKETGWQFSTDIFSIIDEYIEGMG